MAQVQELAEGRLTHTEEGLRTCRKDVQRAVDEAGLLRSEVDKISVTVAALEVRGEPAVGGEKWADKTMKARPRAEEVEVDSGEEESKVVRGTRFGRHGSGRLGATTGGGGGEMRASPKEVKGAQVHPRRRSASPAVRRGAQNMTSDTDETWEGGDVPKRPSSALRGGSSRGGTPSRTARMPLRASYNNGAGTGGGRGLDRAVERELSQLKRMFGL